MENYLIHTSNVPYLPSTWRKWFDLVIAGYGEEKERGRRPSCRRGWHANISLHLCKSKTVLIELYNCELMSHDTSRSLNPFISTMKFIYLMKTPNQIYKRSGKLRTMVK